MGLQFQEWYIFLNMVYIHRTKICSTYIYIYISYTHVCIYVYTVFMHIQCWKYVLYMYGITGYLCDPEILCVLAKKGNLWILFMHDSTWGMAILTVDIHYVNFVA